MRITSYVLQRRRARRQERVAREYREDRQGIEEEFARAVRARLGNIPQSFCLKLSYRVSAVLALTFAPVELPGPGKASCPQAYRPSKDFALMV